MFVTIPSGSGNNITCKVRSTKKEVYHEKRKQSLRFLLHDLDVLTSSLTVGYGLYMLVYYPAKFGCSNPFRTEAWI